MLKTFLTATLMLLCTCMYTVESAIQATLEEENAISIPYHLLSTPSILSTILSPPIVKGCKDSRIASNSNKVQTIVLDAGHGGKDDGCSGKHSKEKHLSLNITLALGQLIETYYPEVQVIYTRTTDVFIPLYQRAAIANDNKADLFISIHCNALSVKLSYIRGTETFVMGAADVSDNTTASRENQSVFLEEGYQQRYQGFDPHSNEGHIFSRIFQNAYLDRSILLAEKIEKYVVQQTNRKSRGVRQDDFVVLRETTMPSVLVESGYLTNARDEGYLASRSGQKGMANAIFLAFQEYKWEVEQESDYVTTTAIPEPPARPTRIATTPPPIHNEPTEVESVDKPLNPLPIEIIEPAAAQRATEPIANEIDTEETLTEVPTIPMEEQTIPPAIEATETEEVIPVVSDREAVENEVESLPIVEEAVAEPEVATKVEQSVIYFSVQVAASPTPINTDAGQWQQVEQLTVQEERNLYKYLSGKFEGYEAAAANRKKLSQLGFKGAFVVAYKEGKRISLKEAKGY